MTTHELMKKVWTVDINKLNTVEELEAEVTRISQLTDEANKVEDSAGARIVLAVLEIRLRKVIKRHGELAGTDMSALF